MLLRGSQHVFPVLDDELHVVGFLSHHDLIVNLSKDGGNNLPVARAMRPAAAFASPDEAVLSVFERMQNSQLSVLPVFGGGGRLLGLLTLESVAEVVTIKRALEKARAEHSAQKRAAPASRRGVAVSTRIKPPAPTGAVEDTSQPAKK